jgi:hypothetical protein
LAFLRGGLNIPVIYVALPANFAGGFFFWSLGNQACLFHTERMRIHSIPVLLLGFATFPLHAEKFDEAQTDYARELAACSSYYQITSGQTRKEQQKNQKTADISYNFSSEVLGEEEAKRVYEQEKGELEKTLGDCLPGPGRVTRESLGCETLTQQVHAKYAENCDTAMHRPTQRIEYWKSHEPPETPASAAADPVPEASETSAPEAADPTPDPGPVKN